MQPTPKMTAAGIGGAVAVIVVWLITALTTLEVPPEVAVAFGAICSFAAGYIKAP